MLSGGWRSKGDTRGLGWAAREAPGVGRRTLLELVGEEMLGAGSLLACACVRAQVCVCAHVMITHVWVCYMVCAGMSVYMHTHVFMFMPLYIARVYMTVHVYMCTHLCTHAHLHICVCVYIGVAHICALCLIHVASLREWNWHPSCQPAWLWAGGCWQGRSQCPQRGQASPSGKGSSRAKASGCSSAPGCGWHCCLPSFLLPFSIGPSFVWGGNVPN